MTSRSPSAGMRSAAANAFARRSDGVLTAKTSLSMMTSR